ncbi:MAG: cytochrome c biogenesis protein CcsA [Candidatus Limisoma sp.]
MTKRILKPLVAVLFAGLLLCLITGSIVDRLLGNSVALQEVYTSPAMIALWTAFTVTALVILVRKKVYRRRATFLLHLALVLILAGAATTWLFGIRGSIHLRLDAGKTSQFALDDGSRAALPFDVELRNFEILYYPGTQSPMDYVASLAVADADKVTEGSASMNSVFRYRYYRFYQSSYDADGAGVHLNIQRDPWGIALSYAGYAALLLCFIAFFFERNSGFRTALKRLKTLTAAVFVLFCCSAHAESAPKTVPKAFADEFGKLLVYHNDRICPVQTLARNFVLKTYGSASYKGLTAEQVLCGWLFYYDDWKTEPMIKIKDAQTRALLGIDGRYARLTDFVDLNGFKLENADADTVDARNRNAANEKFNLACMASTGSLLRIFPCANGNDIRWLSLADRIPANIDATQAAFIQGCMSLVAEQIAARNYDEAGRLVGKIADYQVKYGGTGLPDATQINAERTYNALSANRPIAMACLAVGIAAMLVYCFRRRLMERPAVRRTAAGVLWLLTAYLGVVFALRWWVGGHLPMSNGFETMMFMALCSAAAAAVLCRKTLTAIPFGFLLSGTLLLVAMMGESSPQITNLVPVLNSPLLSIHVATVMMAYTLFALMFVNALAAVIMQLRRRQDVEIERLALISKAAIYPAVALLAAGIFIGAVWANVSWGRYWGWDPKEVWALITMLVYSVPLHATCLTSTPARLHTFLLCAFLSVLITYFGVNLLLGGMHSYAG